MIGRTAEVNIRHNTQVKRYPDGSASLLCLEAALIRERGWEAENPRDGDSDASHDVRTPEEKAADNLQRSRRRARSAVADLARSNPLDYFVTLTVDASILDRYDPAAVFAKLHTWLDNRVRRDGLLYVLIPELHKDGAIHFHALVNDALALVDSGTLIPPEGGRPRRPRSAQQRAEWLAAGGVIVYNLPGWKYGFSTAMKLHGDRAAAIGYVTKYITKTQQKIGGRWYYSGGRLQRPDVWTTDVDFDQIVENVTERDVFTIQELGCKAVKLWISGGNVDETLERLG